MKYDVFAADLIFYYEDLHVLIPIAGTLISYMIFWFAWQSASLKSKLMAYYGHDSGSARLLIYTKILGGLVMGLLPAMTYLIAFPDTRLIEFRWVFPKETLLETAILTLGLGAIMVVVVSRNARKPEHLKQYPQIRARIWNRSMLIWDLISWAIYLIGYESLFRGVLLFTLIDHIGLWPSIAINIGFYAAFHIPKGLKETIGSIPFGLVLCVLTVLVGNIWLAIIVHIAIAWTNEYASLKHQPDMQLVTHKNQ